MEIPPIPPHLQELSDKLIAGANAAIPAPVMAAFLPEGLRVGSLLLQPPHFAHILLLQSADSPFVTGRPVTMASVLMDIATAVHILAHPWAQTREEVKRGTIAERIWETAAQIPAMSPEGTADLLHKIAAFVNDAFATVLPMGREKDEAEDSGAQKKMPVSAGGSSS